MVKLKEKAIVGFVWSLSDRCARQGSAFFIQIILARLLLPEEFGLVAMVSGFVVLSGVLVDGGFGRALLQRKEVGDRELSTVFYFNIVTSSALALILSFSAPSIAQFYGMAELELIMQVLSVGIIISSFADVQRAVVGRNLLFKILFRASFPATILSGVIGVWLAFDGFGVWALVAQSLSQQFLYTVIIWVQSSWRPRLIFSFDVLRELFPFGAQLALSSFLDRGFNNIYILVIGKVFAPVEVGYFQRAKSFQQLPVANLKNALVRVIFPLFSSMQDDLKRLKSCLIRALQLSALGAFLGMALLAASAESLVHVVLGEQWLPSVKYLELLCFYGAMFPLHALNMNVMSSLGRSDLFLRIEVTKRIFDTISIFCTYRLGVEFMIFGMILSSFLGFALSVIFTSRLINFTMIEQLIVIAPIIVLSLLVYFVAWTISMLSSFGPYFELLAVLLSGAIVCLLGLRFMGAELKEELAQVLSRKPIGRSFVRVFL